MKYYVLFGPPGAGKGTQAGEISKKFNLCHISTGELLRAEIASGSELGKQAKSLIDAGNLVPDSVVEDMLAKRFAAPGTYAGFLLDGFPRTISQAQDLDEMLGKTNEEVSGVLSIMIPDEMIAQRIAHRAGIEGRADDANPETIKNRIRTYHEKTEPLIEFYKKQGKYMEADGCGTIEEVRDRLAKLVK